MDDSNDLFSTTGTSAETPAPKTENTAARQPAAAAPKAARTEASKAGAPASGDTYDASTIEVLEGLEPVRRRPGMYIGGTDERALHHLFAEVIDNSMDEAVAGHANFIEVELDADGYLSVTDNGRGIPVENHPKFPGKSTLEVIMTVLHAGGKFDSKVYETSGGLHGVGVSVVNALSDDLVVEIARNKKLYRQRFSRGIPQGGLEELGDIHNRRGTKVRFHPDPDEHARGLLTHRGTHWMFHYDDEDADDDEAGFRLGDHIFTEGEYVTIASHGETPLTYKITDVTAIADL